METKSKNSPELENTNPAKWHQKKIKEVTEELKTSKGGLSPDEALKRLVAYGPNELKEKKKKTPFMMFLDLLCCRN